MWSILQVAVLAVRRGINYQRLKRGSSSCGGGGGGTELSLTL